MRAVILFLGLLFIASPALALGDAAIEYCLSTTNPKGCIQSMLANQEQVQREKQTEMLQAQLEQARIQANGMALFGSGFAFVNGMNRGLQNMQLPPPPVQHIHP